MKTWHVPDMEARLETLRLWREAIARQKDLQEARDARQFSMRSNAVSEALARLYEDYEAKRHNLSKWYYAEAERIEGPDTTIPLEEKANIAEEAYAAAGMTVVEDDGEPALCVVTGAPIMEEDEVIETGDGSLILASAFVPREILDQFKGGDEPEEDDVEEAA